MSGASHQSTSLPEQSTTRALWCLILGDSTPFKVSCHTSTDINDLKKLIRQEGIEANLPVLAKDLVLWKVDIDLGAYDGDSLEGLSFDADGERAHKLKEWKPISDYWTEQPPSDRLSIFVKLPATATISPSSSNDSDVTTAKPYINPAWSPRCDTVEALYQRLNEFGLFQVRGTPGSGKTVLLNLLHTHIIKKDPSAIVVVAQGWSKERLQTYIHLEDRMRAGIKEYPFTNPQKTYLLFDNAQDTYWDTDLWENFFKDRAQLNLGPITALFCSYGSPSYRPVQYKHGTPLALPPCARISLRPTPCGDDHHAPFGLLFSRPEFKQVIERVKTFDGEPFQMDDELRDMLFTWTARHAGAVGGLVDSLASKHVRRPHKWTNKEFLDTMPQQSFCAKLDGFKGFRRGLPSYSEMHDPANATVFHDLIAQGSIVVGGANMDVDNDPLVAYHRHGWIHADAIENETLYKFASPLHATYISWSMMPPTIECPFETVKEMAFALLKKFNRSQLSSPAHMGEIRRDKPHEARYQYEFYCVLKAATGGGAVIAPEFHTAVGAPRGRIDFFIPGKKWGIELLRDGTDGTLVEHGYRFIGGAYGLWLASNEMVDYIVLDCRTDKPKKSHLRIAQLYHAVFEEDFRFVTFLDNMQNELGRFALLGGCS